MKILKGATVFTDNTLKKRDIGIVGQKIVKIEKDLTGDEIDCTGLLILPGAIDIHVHFRDFSEKHKEDWYSGSRAAAKGGTTTVFDMVNNNPPITTYERLMKKKRLAKKSIINYGLYFGLGPENLGNLDKVAKKVCGFKLHMCKTTGDLLLTDPALQKKAFEAVKKTKKPIVIHAEDQKTLDNAANIHRKRTDHLAHADSRPRLAESKAVSYAITCAKQTGAKTHLTHTSTRLALTRIRKAKQTGIDLTCDTTPTYMYFTRNNLEKMGAYCKMNPPVRTKDDLDSVWESVKYGIIDIISTDHAPHTIEEKNNDFKTAPAGIPGVEMRIPLLLDAVNNNRLSLETLVKTCCTNPAKRFNLKGRGEIKTGNYADLIAVNMDLRKEVTRQDQVTKCGWSPYEGMSLKGWPIKTFVNGNLVYNFGKLYHNQGKDLFE
ncbi:MAG: dihydroorotase family protein [archaeon]|nr:dihydroorotase family protein [archaeon]